VRRTVLILAALLLAGCSGDDGGGGSTVSASKGEDLVLSSADVGKVFTQFDEGEQQRTDMAPPRDDPSRFHRQGGWKARFGRNGTVRTKGPLVIESRADLFESTSDANNDFDLYKEALDELASGAAGQTVEPAPELGEEAHAVTFRQGLPPTAVRTYAVAWRQGNVTGYVLVNGFDTRLTLADAVELARKQEKRIRRASGEA
jgi:hypothetical protein